VLRDQADALVDRLVPRLKNRQPATPTDNPEKKSET
jgi:hypothetical protein